MCRGVSCYHPILIQHVIYRMNLALLANELVKARLSGQQVKTTEHPADIQSAYLLQDEVTKASSEPIVGFKIGATATETQEILGLSEPFFGPLLQPFCQRSSTETARLALHEAHTALIECEFVVSLKQDLRRTQNDLTMEDVAAATDWVAAGFEIVGTRFLDTPNKGLCAIADNGNNIGVLTGEPNHDWSIKSLEDHPVSLAINGKSIDTGSSSNSVVGHPFGMLAWLANHDQLRSRGLKKDEIIYTGTVTAPTQISAGDEIVADYGSLGVLNLNLVST